MSNPDLCPTCTMPYHPSNHTEDEPCHLVACPGPTRTVLVDPEPGPFRCKVDACGGPLAGVLGGSLWCVRCGAQHERGVEIRRKGNVEEHRQVAMRVAAPVASVIMGRRS